MFVVAINVTGKKVNPIPSDINMRPGKSGHHQLPSPK